MPAFVTISEVQRLLSVSRSTVYRLIERGELGTIHFGRAVRIPSHDIEAFIQRLSDAA